MKRRKIKSCILNFQNTAFPVRALAIERQPKAAAQQPPAMREGLKLKQRDILSAIMVCVQAAKVKSERMSLMANRLTHTK